MFSDNEKAVGYAWNLMGFVAKLAQGVSVVACGFCGWVSLFHNISPARPA